MTHSPIFLKSLNRLIGKTMRQVQLATNATIKAHLKGVIRWLNKARLELIRGNLSDYRINLSMAHLYTKWAIETKAQLSA